jgi:hypothetical protein
MPSAQPQPNVSSIVRWMNGRLMPFLLLMYVMAFLDRTNVGFAKEAFQASTAVSNAAYAFGASVFFVGYAILEVPSNLLLTRFGARIWLARIMITWGLVSAAMFLIQGETSFYLLRMLLGVAEAGFFPGVIFYMTQFYPSAYRARDGVVLYRRTDQFHSGRTCVRTALVARWSLRPRRMAMAVSGRGLARVCRRRRCAILPVRRTRHDTLAERRRKNLLARPARRRTHGRRWNTKACFRH